MLGDITVADEIYIVCGYTDMRRAIDGLCAIVQDKLHMDPRRSARSTPGQARETANEFLLKFLLSLRDGKI